MNIAIVKERWKGHVLEVTLGREPDTVVFGGEGTLPFLAFEGCSPRRPVVALEIWDEVTDAFPRLGFEALDEVLEDPVGWARRAEELGADVAALRLVSTHPDGSGLSAEDAAQRALAVAEAVKIPLVVLGCDVASRDAETLPVVAAALEGRGCLLGLATADNYRPIAEACHKHGHAVIASTPLDINLAKQLNILITDAGLPLDRIVIDPSIGALGYGLDYAYSIMERMRLGVLGGDRMLAPPVICLVGDEAWKSKEAQAIDRTEWGRQGRRAVLWEAVTAAALAQAGGSLFLFRHPEAMRLFQAQIDDLRKAPIY